MARPTTDELKYYSRDTKSQQNEQYIEAVHGPVGFYILEKLRMHIYGSVGGYYCEFKEIHQRLFCKHNGNISLDQLKEVLKDCFLEDVNLFDKDLFETHNILTSAGIQKRWKRIVVDAGRKNVVIHPDYCLIEGEETPDKPPVNGGETTGKQVENTPTGELTGGLQGEKPPIIGGETGVSPVESTQTKLDKIRIEESKEKENQGGKGANSLPSPPQQGIEDGKKKADVGGSRPRRTKLQPPTEPEVIDHFKTTTAGTMHPAAAEMEAKKFLAHYQANGWVQNGNKPIVDWKAASSGWLLRSLGGEYAMKAGVVVKSAAGVSVASSDSDIAKETEYMYQRYLEDHLEISFLQPKHYDLLKKSGLVNLTSEQTEGLMQQAINGRIKALEGSNEARMLRLMSAYIENKPHDQDPIKSDIPRLYSILKPLALQLIFQQAKDAGQPAILKSLGESK